MTMQEPITRAEQNARHLVCDERFRRDKERLTDHDATLKQLSEVSLKLSLLVEQHERKLEQNDTRIDCIEMKPAKRWEVVVGDVIKFVMAVALGYLASKVGLG